MRKLIGFGVIAASLVYGGLTASAQFATESTETVTTAQTDMISRDRLLLRGLDKVTGRSTNIEAQIGEEFSFGHLRVTVEACFQNPPELPPESAAFLQVREIDIEADEPVDVDEVPEDVAVLIEPANEEPLPTIFSGWMFASTPGLNALEHSVYDIWVIRCMASEPATDETPADPSE